MLRGILLTVMGLVGFGLFSSHVLAQTIVVHAGTLLAVPGEAPLTFGQARDWIERHESLPFFLFVHTYEVHSPYDPEEPHAALFAGDGAPGPENAAVRAARDRYDREIRSVDDELRGLFRAAQPRGRAGAHDDR